MMDNMLEGRFIFGISPGALMTDAEALGTLDKDRFKMFEDAINVILEIYAQDNQFGKRVNASLLGVMFHSDGEAFGGGTTATLDDFDGFTSEAESSPAGANPWE